MNNLAASIQLTNEGIGIDKMENKSTRRRQTSRHLIEHHQSENRPTQSSVNGIKPLFGVGGDNLGGDGGVGIGINGVTCRLVNRP